MARAKQTGRAEARRRHRQASAVDSPRVDDGAELDYGERRPDAGSKPAARAGRSQDRAPTGRVGFFDAFRQAYRPAHVREDLRALPALFRSRGFLAAIALTVATAVALYFFPAYTGTQTLAELVLRPGSALAPELIAGFFAVRASYLLGAIVGLVQTVSFIAVISTERYRTAFEAIAPGAVAPLDTGAILNALVSGIVLGSVFAAMAAWYRRFLSLSSPRRAPAGRSPQRRSASR